MNDSNDNWKDLFEQLPVVPTARKDHQQQLKTRMLDVFDHSQRPSVSTTKSIGKTIMKYKVPQLTAAAIAIVIAASTLNFGGTAFALENVVANLVNTKSASWETVVDLETLGKQTSKTFIIPGRSRTENEDGSVTIHDWRSGRALTLLPDSKTALQIDVGKQAQGLDSFNVFQSMRDSLGASLESKKLDNVESLGTKLIDGQMLTGFRLNGDQKITIWADPETEVAVQIEVQVASNGTAVVMKNYKPNVAFDDALFSLDIPDGYKTTQVDLPSSLPSEAEFIRTLRLSCETGDGTFPPGLDISSTSKVSVRMMMDRIESMSLDASGVNGAQLEELTRNSMGFQFATMLSVRSDSDAHYAGANVKLAEKDRAIFWYRPRGSKQYRIIYADLTVKEADLAPVVDNAVKL